MPIYIKDNIKIVEGDNNFTLDTVKAKGKIESLNIEQNTNSKIIETVDTFIHDGSSNNFTTHSITFNEPTECDVLIVGGGGAGGADTGGGGGGGQVLYYTNDNVSFKTGNSIILNGTYNIKVGNGGTTNGADGNNTVISYNSSDIYIAGGGGGGGTAHSTNALSSPLGGGGGGNAGGSADKNGAISTGGGGQGGISGLHRGGGGGGGANIRSALTNGGDVNGSVTGSGGTGVNIYITGESFGVGGGGSGGSYLSSGVSSGSVSHGGGQGGIYYTAAGSGTNNTGGGGGGSGYSNSGVGTGGSGIVIIKKIKSVNNYDLLYKTQSSLTESTVLNADATNLIAHYKFDDNLNNSVNNSIGTLVSTNTAATFIDTSGNYIFGKSALVNNTTLTIPNFHFSNLIEGTSKSFTISFWFKANNMTGTWNILFDASNYTSGVSAGIRVYIKDNDYLYLYSYNSSSTNHYRYSLNGEFYTDNKWRLFTFVYTYVSNATDVYTFDVKLYENGVLNNKINSSGATNSGSDIQTIKLDNSNGFQIGDGNPDTVYPSEGYYDDFRIYDKALSATEIYYLANKISGIPQYTSLENDATNLIAHYKFDDSTDIGKCEIDNNTNNLTTNNVSLVDSIFNYAVDLDGSTSYLKTSAIDLATTNVYTISFWVKFNTAPSGANQWFWSQGTGSTGLSLAFLYEQVNNCLRFSHYGSGNDIDSSGYNMTTTLGTQWNFIAVTYDENNSRTGEIYLNGIKLTTNISSMTNSFTGTGDFYISYSQNNGGTINGQMDDFRIYNKVLSATEIYYLANKMIINTEYKTLAFTYKSNIPAIDADSTNLIAHYKFKNNYNPGFDSTDNENHLTTKIGTPEISTTQSIYGRSLSLFNSSLETNTFTLHNKPFSIAVWIYRTTNSNQYLLTQRLADTTNQNLHIVHMTTNKWRFGFYANDLDSQTAYDDLNKWVHLVFQIDSNKKRELWRNGVLNGTDTSSAFLNVSNNVIIGSVWNNGSYLNSYLDDLRIYDRALTADEINNIYNHEKLSYELTFNHPVTCDILIVGGGGGGGYWGGGGGAGAILSRSNVNLLNNKKYTITVGKGGSGSDNGNNNGNNGTNTSFKFDDNTIIEALGGGGGGSFNFQSGLKYEYYNQGYFADNVNWFNSYSPVATGYVTDGTNIGTFSNNTRTVNSADNYSFEWTGYFKASVSGTYTFYTQSDDASYCWVGTNAISGFTTSNALVNNGSTHGVIDKSGTINLTANTYYPIRYQFGEASGGDDMRVSFTPPGSSRTYNGNGYFYSYSNGSAGNDGGSGGGGSASTTGEQGGSSIQQDYQNWTKYVYSGQQGSIFTQTKDGGNGGGNGENFSSIYGVKYGDYGIFGKGGSGSLNETLINNSGNGGSGGIETSTNGIDGSSGIVIIRYKSSTQEINYDAQWTHNQEESTIYYYGNVGIGNNANDFKLNINGDINVTNDYYKNNELIILNNWQTNGTDIYNINGNVGIDYSSPLYKLDVNGSIFASNGGVTGDGSTSWSVSSDVRIKNNIELASYKECYENLKKMNLFKFTYKEGYNTSQDINQLGFIAQEIETQYPKSINTVNDIKRLNVSQINYNLFGAMKYLINEIEELKTLTESNTSNINT